jgi:hypothetical protein
MRFLLALVLVPLTLLVPAPGRCAEAGDPPLNAAEVTGAFERARSAADNAGDAVRDAGMARPPSEAAWQRAREAVRHATVRLTEARSMLEAGRASGVVGDAVWDSLGEALATTARKLVERQLSIPPVADVALPAPRDEAEVRRLQGVLDEQGKTLESALADFDARFAGEAWKEAAEVPAATRRSLEALRAVRARSAQDADVRAALPGLVRRSGAWLQAWATGWEAARATMLQVEQKRAARKRPRGGFVGALGGIEDDMEAAGPSPMDSLQERMLFTAARLGVADALSF